jgi:hypothetical protein
MLTVCEEAVMMSDSKNLKKEEEGDIKGIQMNTDYKQISVLNVAAIQRLLKRIEHLESTI